MGFGGGGGAALPNHQHTNTPLTGGPLDFGGVTVGSMSQGDLTYSNGTTLQVLNLGNATETLSVNPGATAPEWAAAGGASYEFLERFVLVANDDITCTLATPISVTDLAEVVIIWRGKWSSGGTHSLGLQIGTDNNHPISTSTYSWLANVMNGNGIMNGAYGTDINNFTIGPSTTAAGSMGNIIMQFCGNPTDLDRIFCKWWQIGTNVTSSWGSGFTYDDATFTEFTGVKFFNSSGGTSNISSGTTVDFYKINAA